MVDAPLSVCGRANDGTYTHMCFAGWMRLSREDVPPCMCTQEAVHIVLVPLGPPWHNKSVTPSDPKVVILEKGSFSYYIYDASNNKIIPMYPLAVPRAVIKFQRRHNYYASWNVPWYDNNSHPNPTSIRVCDIGCAKPILSILAWLNV